MSLIHITSTYNTMWSR